MENTETVVYSLFEPGDTCRLVHGCRKGGEEKKNAWIMMTIQLAIYTGRHSCTVYSDQRAFENLFFSKNQPLVWFVTCLRLLLPPHTSTLTSSQLLLFPVHGIESDDERAKARSALTAHKRREFSFSVYIRRHSNLQQWLRGSKCESGLFDTERCGQQHYVLTLSSWETNAHSKRPFRQFFFFFKHSFHSNSLIVFTETNQIYLKLFQLLRNV